jgi:hypothetical protein
MKRFTSTFLLIFILSQAIFAQNLVLSYEGEPIPPDSEIFVSGSASLGKIIAPFTLTNHGNDSLKVKVKKIEIDTLPGSSNSFCFGGICNGPSVYETSYWVVMEPNAADTTFEGDYYPYQNIGQSTIAYVFFDKKNPADSVKVTVTYDGIITGEEENIFNPLSISDPYPNPSKGSVTFDIPAKDISEQITIQIIDLNGKRVQTIKVIANLKRIETDLGHLINGVYFYRLMTTGSLIKSGKLILDK